MTGGQADQIERFDAVTEDPGEIDELTRMMFGASVRVERHDGRPASLRLAQAATTGFGVQRVTWNVDGRCEVGPLERFLCIRLHRGAYGLDQGSGRVTYAAGDTFLADPGRKVDAEVIGADLDSFTIDQGVLQDVALQLAPWSRGRLDFRQAVPVTPQLGRVWDGVLDHVTQSMRDDDLVAENPLIRATLQHLLAATACGVFGLLEDPRGDERVTTRSVSRALSYIDDRLAEPITVGDIAAAAGLSVRGLQDAFRRDLDITPMQQLTRARLSAARRDLLEADPTTGTTVADIARKWGFGQMGRFAGRYRSEFGESPRTTLRG